MLTRIATPRAGLKADPAFSTQLLGLAQQLAGISKNPWIQWASTDAQGYGVVTITPDGLSRVFKTLNRLVRFIEQFRQMNFANDTDMERQLEAVRQELLTRSAEEYRDSASARQTLVRGLTHLREEARQLATADTTALVQRFGQLGRRKFNLAA